MEIISHNQKYLKIRQGISKEKPLKQDQIKDIIKDMADPVIEQYRQDLLAQKEARDQLFIKQFLQKIFINFKF